MSEKINRRDEIVRVATELFMKNGYVATSVRDIAQEVKCTEAALYYHFKEGKRELFKEVIGVNMPSLMNVLEACQGAESLYDLIMRYAQSMLDTMIVRAERFRWVISEFPQFEDEERKIFHDKHMTFHNGLTELILPFAKDEAEAHRLAWIIVCTGIGYMQLFYALDLKSVVTVEPAALIEQMAKALSLQAGIQETK